MRKEALRTVILELSHIASYSVLYNHLPADEESFTADDYRVRAAYESLMDTVERFHQVYALWEEE